jgi:hypothetical protein
VYTEDEIITDLAEVKSLHDVPGWSKFVQATNHLEPQNYLFDAQRFCHKVYAMLDAFQSRHRYVVWIDADTEATAKFGQTRIKSLIDGKMCAFLGRRGSYTETGFIAFDTHHHDFPEFEKRFREFYDKRYLFLLDYWIDCTAFDASIANLETNNLTPEAAGMMNVFDRSVVGKFLRHDKGQGHGKYRGAA